MVTLQHFTLPDWLSDPRRPEEPQGWERPETIDAFGTWCSRIAARWGGEVDWWATINEPLASSRQPVHSRNRVEGRLLRTSYV